MKLTALDFDQIPQLSTIDLAYQQQVAALQPFFEYSTEVEQFEKVIAAKQDFDPQKRAILVAALEQQYQSIETSCATLDNIKRLQKTATYTVTTAHQPNLFTGPLYSIYKIVSTINLAKKLKATYPNFDFVPIFWTGGEDHDFEEVNHFNLFGNKISWDEYQGGSVGAYQLRGFDHVLEQTKEILGNSPRATEVSEKLTEFYTTSANYGEAHTQFINWIFGKHGLVICNAQAAVFKSQMKAIFKEELLHQPSKEILEKTAIQLTQAGFGNQAYAREINLFYLTANKRSRIVQQGKQYQVLDTELVFSEEEILKELDQNPQKFSPNVILRPLFQETILPNLAYIGGGGELAYWLERKTQFQHFGVPYPMLLRRCSVLWIDKGMNQKVEKAGLTIAQIFEDTDKLLKQYTLENTEHELSLTTQKEQLNRILDDLLQHAIKIDPTLEKAVLGTQAQIINSIDKIEKKLIRAEKSNHETALNAIKNIKEKLFPSNGLQERYDNFLAYYVRYGDDFVDSLIQHLDVLDKRFLILSEEF